MCCPMLWGSHAIFIALILRTLTGHALTERPCSSSSSDSLFVHSMQVVAGSRGGDKPVQPAAQFYLQFLTRYLHEGGQWRCRVTTVTRGCGPLPDHRVSIQLLLRLVN